MMMLIKEKRPSSLFVVLANTRKFSPIHLEFG